VLAVPPPVEEPGEGPGGPAEQPPPCDKKCQREAEKAAHEQERAAREAAREAERAAREAERAQREAERESRRAETEHEDQPPEDEPQQYPDCRQADDEAGDFAVDDGSGDDEHDHDD
jgi:hypothetical protein